MRRRESITGRTQRIGARVSDRGKKEQSSPVVSEAKTAYRVKGKNVGKRRELLKFELDLLKKEKADLLRNFRIVDALYKEAAVLVSSH